jgi:hypothetical protein
MDQAIRSSEISYASLFSVAVDNSDEDHKPHLESRECKRSSCRKQALEDSEFCRPHEETQRRYNRDYDRKRRAHWEAENRCTRCGGKDRKRGSKWCSACLIRLNRLRTSDLNLHLETRRDRVAKRLVPWTNSPQNEGRIRLRGGKRGAPSAEDRDRRDLADIRRVLDRYALALDECYSAEAKDLPRIQRDATVKAAHAGLALAVRLGMEALVTYGYEAPALADDEIGDEDE